MPGKNFPDKLIQSSSKEKDVRDCYTFWDSSCTKHLHSCSEQK